MHTPTHRIFNHRGSNRRVFAHLVFNNLRPALAFIALSLSACSGPDSASAQSEAPPVRYTVSFENAVHHEAEIAVVFPDLGEDPLEVRMSRTSPGRYALHEFAKNVYNVRITGAAGHDVVVSRPNPHEWVVENHGGEVTVRYTLFGNRADGTYASVTHQGALLNIPASMMWARDTWERPVEIRFDIPAGSGWKIATQMAPTNDSETFTAPNTEYFLDSPTLVADFDLRTWTVASNGRDYEIRFALQHDGTPGAMDIYMDQVQRVVLEEMAVFGELPDFDYGTYTFLAVYLPWAAGDGMEHRNSTVLTRAARLPEDAIRLLGTVAHEFFHAWNIERIRPATIEPFDFENANMSRELWFGEGFTSYYDDVAMVRGGTNDLVEFARRMGGLANSVINAPGRRYFSPIEMSMQAPFVDAAVSVDPQNKANTFISYYTWGAALGLGLDLTIRSQFPGKTLDDVMRAVWQRHGIPFTPYTVEDLELALAETVGDADFAKSFFDDFIRGKPRGAVVPVPDFATLFAHAGITLEPSSPGTVTLGGSSMSYEGGSARVASPVLVGTPLYVAGVEMGDRVISLGSIPLRNAVALDRALRGKTPRDRIGIVFESQGVRRTAQLVLGEDPTVAATLFDEALITSEIASFRASWLSAKR